MTGTDRPELPACPVNSISRRGFSGDAYWPNRKPSGAEAHIKVTQRANDLALTLADAGAAGAAIPVTKDLMGPALAELVAKGVVKRSGMTKGRYGKPGVVRIVVAREQLVPVKNRASRAPIAAQPTQLDMPLAAAPGAAALTIDELEAFVQTFRHAQAALLEERSRAIGARIAMLQPYLAVATGDDFRNTMAMANAALRELDDVEHAVNAEVIARLKPDAGSPLFPVWRAMAGR